MIQVDEQKRQDFAQFMQKINRAPIGTDAYYGNTRHDRYRTGSGERRSVCIGRLDLDDIRQILEEGDLAACRRLSYYYYRISGLYRNVILLLSNLSLYQTLVTPVYDINKRPPEEVIAKKFNKAVEFIDALEVPINFARISWKVLLAGSYYGFLRMDKDGYTIQDLPESHCYARFKDCNNLDIIEFDLAYFDTIHDEKLRLEVIKNYPPIIYKMWRKWKNGDKCAQWVSITAAEGACCFHIGDGTPLFIASIPDIYQFEKALGREAQRDENELYKLLIERMPVDSKGELVFQLEEVADIHASVASMLSDIDTVDVLTTFGETSLESIQDSSSANSSTERIKKYKDNVYDAMGVSSLYFNADTSSAMVYSAAKDSALISMLTNQYARWLEVQVNSRFAKTNLHFDVAIMPTTHVNRKDIQSQLFQGAQFGYSKMAAGVATGIKQVDMLPIMDFENTILNMSEKMVPLMSSYTASSKDIQQSSTNSNSDGNLTSESGRPRVDDTVVSETALIHRDSEG